MTGIVSSTRPATITPLSKILNRALPLHHLLIVLVLMFCNPLLSSAQVRPTPGSDRLKVKAQKKFLEQRSLVKEQSFRNIGPSIMSGRVVDLDVNPDDPTEFYVAYATGGLWHTKNNGQSFEPIFDGEDILVIGDIAVNWASGKNSAANRIIWIGTGEVNSSRSSYAG